MPLSSLGFVRLIDTMPQVDLDQSIADAARVSYGAGTKQTRDTRALLRYLLRHRHTSPFEMVEFKFHVRAPIFVARQWFRHRTGSFNEVSARYSIVDADAWIPAAGDLALQSTTNAQGRSEVLAAADAADVVELMRDAVDAAQDAYRGALANNVARELARVVLPVGTFTEWFWKVDLHNLLRFVLLRGDRHAQAEIRAYADEIAAMIERLAPLTWEAFVDYMRDAHTLSAHEWSAVRRVLDAQQIDSIIADVIASGASAREVRELRAALESAA